jgi:hypothetical protein
MLPNMDLNLVTQRIFVTPLKMTCRFTKFPSVKPDKDTLIQNEMCAFNEEYMDILESLFSDLY